jgi:hypothetical protein
MAYPLGDEIALWEGETQNLASAATQGKVITARFRLTNRNLYVSKGVLRTDEQQIPLAYVQDVDVRQALIQKARSVGDVVVHVTRPDGFVDTLIMDSVSDPRRVRDLVNRTATDARVAERQLINHQSITYTGPAPAPSITAPAVSALPTDDVFAQLEKLGKLRDAGVLTTEEFESKKAEMLARL